MAITGGGITGSAGLRRIRQIAAQLAEQVDLTEIQEHMTGVGDRVDTLETDMAAIADTNTEQARKIADLETAKAECNA